MTSPTSRDRRRSSRRWAPELTARLPLRPDAANLRPVPPRLAALKTAWRPGVLATVVAAVVVGATLAAGAVLLIRPSPEPAPRRHPVAAAPPAGSAEPTISTTTTPPPFAAGGPCPTTRTDTLTQGNDPGNTLDGPDAILSFEYAYYVTRSGPAARANVDPAAANIGQAPDIQNGINAVPVGTTHCVAITAQAPGVYLVDITERRPDNSTATWREIVTTTTVDGHALLRSIAAAPPATSIPGAPSGR